MFLLGPQASKNLQELDWEVLFDSFYSLDITPYDYYLFRSLEHFLVNKNFKHEAKKLSRILFCLTDNAVLQKGDLKFADMMAKCC